MAAHSAEATGNLRAEIDSVSGGYPPSNSADEVPVKEGAIPLPPDEIQPLPKPEGADADAVVFSVVPVDARAALEIPWRASSHRMGLFRSTKRSNLADVVLVDVTQT